MIVIALGHKSRSGKDSVADYLVADHGFKKYALADLLKKSVNVVMGWNDDHSYGELKEVQDPDWGVTPRHMYQRIGTEGWRELFRQDVWAHALKLQIKREAAPRVVITDVRFKQGEVSMIRSLGGELWKIDRPSLPPLVLPPRTMFGRVKAWFGPHVSYSHQSEYDMHDYDRWDEVIVNDDTLHVLYAKAAAALDRAISRKYRA